jgi:hypothetical protein
MRREPAVRLASEYVTVFVPELASVTVKTRFDPLAPSDALFGPEPADHSVPICDQALTGVHVPPRHHAPPFVAGMSAA